METPQQEIVFNVGVMMKRKVLFILRRIASSKKYGERK